jgi:hypothetical protein
MSGKVAKKLGDALMACGTGRRIIQLSYLSQRHGRFRYSVNPLLVDGTTETVLTAARGRA